MRNTVIVNTIVILKDSNKLSFKCLRLSVNCTTKLLKYLDLTSVVKLTPFGANFYSKKRKTVIRLSSNKQAMAKNFLALKIAEYNHDLTTPRPVLFYSDGNYAFSVESYIESGNLNTLQIRDCMEDIAKNILCLHQSFSIKKQSKDILLNNALNTKLPDNLKVVFDRIMLKIIKGIQFSEIECSLIHGDFTFRNCLQDGSLLDFDRAIVGPPAFDILQFHTDLMTHKKSVKSYEKWFQEIFKLFNCKDEYLSFLRNNFISKEYYQIDNNLLLLFLSFSITNTIGHYYASYGAAHSIRLLMYIEANLNRTIKNVF